MKKSQLVKLIAPIIQEEVEKALNKVLPSMVAEAFVIMEEQRAPVARTQAPIQQVQQAPVIQETAIPAREPIQYSSNPLINEIMNETEGGLPQDGSDPYLSEGFDMIGDGGMGVPAQAPIQTAIIPTTDTSGGGSTVTAAQLQTDAPEVFNALTRDYSGMMKALDKKKQEQKGPAQIDFSTQAPSNANVAMVDPNALTEMPQ